MSADDQERCQPFHRPLTRVAYGPKVPIGPLSGSDVPQRLAPIVTVCPSSPGPQRADLSTAVSTVSKGSAELQDSCYSSESEHSSLSRNTSAASETLAQEYGPQCSISTSTPSLPLDLAQQLSIGTGECSGDWCGSQDYIKLRDFAIKLGFSQQQLDFVLNKLGVFPPEQDRVLSELTKLGKQDVPCISPAEPCYSDAGQLRTVVIDGSNLAMTHGHKEVFSCLGIRECVEFFRRRGHTDIKVFVPQFRRETPRPDCPITDQHILFELEAEGVLVWTPSRRVGGRRIVCHDDRYILKTAAERDAVVVSNDEYRDLMKETAEFKRVVEERLLMYSFVDGKFMPPDDPLGRHGPTLDQFLRKGGVGASAPLCPYGRKCTYGNKCKFFHPERPGGIHVSVTDRLQGRIQQKKELSATPSCSGSICPSQSLSSELAKVSACRTKSLNFPMMASRQQSPSPKRLSPRNALIPFATLQHQTLSKQCSNPERLAASSPVGHQQAPPPPDPYAARPLTSNSLRATGWPYFAVMQEHQALSRNVSAPGGEPEVGTVRNSGQYFTSHGQRKGSISDSQLHLLGTEDSWPEYQQYSDCFSPEKKCREGSNFFVPSSAVWGSMEYSMGPIPTPSSLPPIPSAEVEQSRKKVYYHLSAIFPEPIVAAVMQANPRENNPQTLCSMILNVHKSATVSNFTNI